MVGSEVPGQECLEEKHVCFSGRVVDFPSAGRLVSWGLHSGAMLGHHCLRDLGQITSLP